MAMRPYVLHPRYRRIGERPPLECGSGAATFRDTTIRSAKLTVTLVLS